MTDEERGASMTLVSPCCGAGVLLGVTRPEQAPGYWHQCTKCGQPCDPVPVEEKEEA